MNYKETKYGFEYGPVTITRLFSDEKKQWVTLEVKTQKEELQIYVTKTGKVRIFSDHNKEWKKP
jgi:hypothetical protein